MTFVTRRGVTQWTSTFSPCPNTVNLEVMSASEGTVGVAGGQAALNKGQLSPDGFWRWNGREWVPAAPSFEPFRWPAVRTVADWRVLLGVATAALLFDVSVRSGALGLGSAGLVIVAALTLLVSGRLVNGWSKVTAALAIVVGTGIGLRASPWLQWADLLVATGLLAVSAGRALDGDPFNLGVRLQVRTVGRLALHLLPAFGFVLGPVRLGIRTGLGARRAALVAILRGIGIALPVAVLITLLLVSADPVFASFFNLNVDFGNALMHALLFALGVWLVGGLMRAASGEPITSEVGPGLRLGSIEVIAAMALLDSVFIAFAVAQLLAAVGAGGDALRAAGITYSDYARNGFFQLLWVAGITFVALLSLRAVAPKRPARGSIAFTLLAQLAVVLTLLIVIVAWRRLSLYEEAYGWTMLRIYSHVFAGWVALAFGLTALVFAGVRSSRDWIYGACVASGVIFLLALNVANPEAIVVRLNVEHANSGHFDAAYLASLSDDAAVAALDSTSGLAPDQARILRARLCGIGDQSSGWAGFTFEGASAAKARHAQCH